jgi:protein dithiol oxidoreductase (disulfide-forming)
MLQVNPSRGVRAIALDSGAMQRAFSRLAAAMLLAAACVSAIAQSLPVAGRDYIVLDPSRTPAPGTAIEVIEFFYYGCPVCYESQPYIARWLERAGDGVTLRRVPAASFAGAEDFALTYYALEATGHLAQFHGAVYENHHFDDLRLSEEKNLLAWLARNGVDAERFREVRNSAETRARLAESRRMFEDYNVRGVPSIAIDGRYLTSARLAGSVKEMMEVVAYLVGRAHEERQKK